VYFDVPPLPILASSGEQLLEVLGLCPFLGQTGGNENLGCQVGLLRAFYCTQPLWHKSFLLFCSFFELVILSWTMNGITAIPDGLAVGPEGED
jgi:hypothetical protein